MTTISIMGGGAAQSKVNHFVKNIDFTVTKKQDQANEKVIYGHFPEQLYTFHQALANCPDDAYSFVVDPLYRAFIDDMGRYQTGGYGARQRRGVEIIRFEEFIRENYRAIRSGQLEKTFAGSEFRGEQIDQLKNPLHRLFLNFELLGLQSSKVENPLRCIDARAGIFLCLEIFTVQFYKQDDYLSLQKCPVFALPVAQQKSKAVRHG